MSEDKYSLTKKLYTLFHRLNRNPETKQEKLDTVFGEQATITDRLNGLMSIIIVIGATPWIGIFATLPFFHIYDVDVITSVSTVLIIACMPVMITAIALLLCLLPLSAKVTKWQKTNKTETIIAAPSDNLSNHKYTFFYLISLGYFAWLFLFNNPFS